MLKLLEIQKVMIKFLLERQSNFWSFFAVNFREILNSCSWIARVGSVIMMMENFPIFSVKRRKFEAETESSENTRGFTR